MERNRQLVSIPNNQSGRRFQEFISGLWDTEIFVLPLEEFGKICLDQEETLWAFLTTWLLS